MEIHISETTVLSIIGNKTQIIIISLYLHELEVLLPIPSFQTKGREYFCKNDPNNLHDHYHVVQKIVHCHCL